MPKPTSTEPFHLVAAPGSFGTLCGAELRNVNVAVALTPRNIPGSRTPCMHCVEGYARKHGGRR